MFESGDVWVVEQGFDQTKQEDIQITEYRYFSHKYLDNEYVMDVADWTEVLNLFSDKCKNLR